MAEAGRAPRIRALILDAAPLLTQSKIAGLAEKYYIAPSVLAELRDVRAREFLEHLHTTGQIDLEVREPGAEAMRKSTCLSNAVIHFAKQTGDYAVLSPADMHVLALTYALEVELHGTWRIRETVGGKVRGIDSPRPVSSSMKSKNCGKRPSLVRSPNRSRTKRPKTFTAHPSEQQPGLSKPRPPKHTSRTNPKQTDLLSWMHSMDSSRMRRRPRLGGPPSWRTSRRTTKKWAANGSRRPTSHNTKIRRWDWSQKSRSRIQAASRRAAVGERRAAAVPSQSRA